MKKRTSPPKKTRTSDQKAVKAPARPKLAAREKPVARATVPAPGSLAALLRAVAERADERTRRIEEAKREFERAAREMHEVVALHDKPEPGPRRFRPGPTRSREIQKKMSDLGVEMRILAARRAELQWLQQILGGTP